MNTGRKLANSKGGKFMEPLNDQAASEQTANPAERMPSRRRLIKAGALGATVVVATLASRPALAHTCKTPSAFGSMNVSRPPQLVECGLSHGYWKNHPDKWPAGLPPTMPFNTAFPVGQPASPANLTLMQALDMGGGGLIMLRRQVITALLNLRANVAPGFLTEAEIRGMWAAASTSQNYVNSTRGINWTPAQVLAYFDSLFV